MSLKLTVQLRNLQGLCFHRLHQAGENPRGSTLYEKIRKLIKQSSDSLWVFCLFFCFS